MASLSRRDYDDIHTPDNGKKRKFGVQRRVYGGGVENSRDGCDGRGSAVETQAFERARTVSAIGRLRQEQPDFDFSDRSHMPGQRPSANARGEAPAKYIQPRRVIQPGAAIMQSREEEEAKIELNDEEKRLKKLLVPPSKQDPFVDRLLRPAARMRAKTAPSQMSQPPRRVLTSLETASAPSASAARSTYTRSTATPSSASAAASKPKLLRDEWKAPVRLKRDQDSPSSERPKRSRVELTPADRSLQNKARPSSVSSSTSGGPLLRTSSRLGSRQPRNTYGMYDSDDGASKTKTTQPTSSRKSYDGSSKDVLAALSLRRNTRASKEKNKEGTEDMPIQLADSDDDDEEEEDASQATPALPVVDEDEVDANERSELGPGEARRDLITDMEGYRVWFGNRTCRLDFHIHKKCLWLRSIRGVGSKWPLEREYKIPFGKIKNVRVYRLDESQAGEYDKTDRAGKVMSMTSFIAFQFPIPDAMKKAEWREFYDPMAPTSEESSSKQFFIAVARDEDKNGSMLATLDDVFQPHGIDIQLMSTLDEVRPFADTMLDNDLHYIFTDRPSAPAKESKRARRRREADDDMDATQLTYPLPPCNVDIVTITRSDISRLQPAEYLNDNIIDYYLKRLLLEDYAENELLKQNVLFLSSHFYSRLRAGRGVLLKDRLLAGYKNVSTWLTRSDLFNRSLIFIPINKDMHWSLAVIVNPKCAGNADSDKDDPGPKTCIALLDPLGAYHSRAPIQRNLKSFLSFEWERVSSSNTYRSSDIMSVEVRAPIQGNSYDCGVYVLKYAQEMLKNFAEMLVKTEEEIDDKGGFLVPREATDDGLSALIAQDAFAGNDVTQKRQELQELLAEDTKRYEAILESR